MGKNERGAGRKSSLTEEQFIVIKKRHEEGETITALAQEYGISRQALSKRMNSKKEDVDIICQSLAQWRKQNQDFQVEDMERYQMRMDYMCEDTNCTSILIDFQNRNILVKNDTENPLHRAFGIKAKPDWKDFEEFLKERCVSESRIGLDVILNQLGLDTYDPLAIVEKTHGRMAEDLQWIRLSYYTKRTEKMVCKQS
ncbi:MAG: Hin recombinase [Lachnospiraceae bacterium]|nr:Hin recombinase [Lachnospiraceae bacterium]